MSEKLSCCWLLLLENAMWGAKKVPFSRPRGGVIGHVTGLLCFYALKGVKKALKCTKNQYVSAH